MTAPGHRRIPYWGIRQGIEKAIKNWHELHGIRVELEPSGEPSPESLPAFFIFMSERQTPAERQHVSAGKRTDHRLVFSVWALAYSTESMAAAAEQRDGLVAELELALMADRKLDGLLSKSLVIEGGFIQSGSDRKPALFATAAETLVIVEEFAQLA